MGFFEKAGKFAVQAGKATLEAAEKKAERIERYKEKNDCLSDERLIKKYKSATGDEKFACAMLLKERGYGNQD